MSYRPALVSLTKYNCYSTFSFLKDSVPDTQQSNPSENEEKVEDEPAIEDDFKDEDVKQEEGFTLEDIGDKEEVARRKPPESDLPIEKVFGIFQTS